MSGSILTNIDVGNSHMSQIKRAGEAFEIIELMIKDERSTIVANRRGQKAFRKQQEVTRDLMQAVVASGINIGNIASGFQEIEQATVVVINQNTANIG